MLCIRPAIQYPNVTLETNSKVVRLETDASGRTVTGVVVERPGGHRETYRGDIVVVSCGAINSALLLLRSTSEQHPKGFANSSDVVGRHYMAHINSAVIALSKELNKTRFQKTLGVNDYYWGSDDFDFPLGHIQMLGKTDGQMLKATVPPFVPGFALDYVARHAVDFWLTTEDLPQPANRVTLGRNGRIEVHYSINNLEPHKRLLARLKGLLTHLDMHPHLFPQRVIRDERIPIAGVSHQCGTRPLRERPSHVRARRELQGPRPGQPLRRRHELFPSSSAVNPALTAMANALRVGDHLSERLGASGIKQSIEKADSAPASGRKD